MYKSLLFLSRGQWHLECELTKRVENMSRDKFEMECTTQIRCMESMISCRLPRLYNHCSTGKKLPVTRKVLSGTEIHNE